MNNLVFSTRNIDDFISDLANEVIKKIHLESSFEPHSDLEIPIQLDEVVLITGLTKPTLYAKVQRNEIPYNKKGNRLYFFKSQIIDWIKIGRVKTVSEIEDDADSYLSKKRKG